MNDTLQKYTPQEISKITNIKELVNGKKMADTAAIFYAAQDKWLAKQQATEIALRFCRQAGIVLLPPDQGGMTPREKGNNILDT